MKLTQNPDKKTQQVLNQFVEILKEYDATLTAYQQYLQSLGVAPPPVRTSTDVSVRCAISQKYLVYIQKYGVPSDGYFDENLLASC